MVLPALSWLLTVHVIVELGEVVGVEVALWTLVHALVHCSWLGGVW